MRDALGVFQEKAVEDKAEEEYKDSRRFQYHIQPVVRRAEPAADADAQDVGSGNEPYQAGCEEKCVSRYSECHEGRREGCWMKSDAKIK